jgi:hypothetical protein
MFGKQVPVAPPRHPFADYFDPVQVVKRVILSTLSSISAGWDPAPDLAGLPVLVIPWLIFSISRPTASMIAS